MRHKVDHERKPIEGSAGDVGFPRSRLLFVPSFLFSSVGPKLGGHLQVSIIDPGEVQEGVSAILLRSASRMATQGRQRGKRHEGVEEGCTLKERSRRVGEQER